MEDVRTERDRVLHTEDLAASEAPRSVERPAAGYEEPPAGGSHAALFAPEETERFRSEWSQIQIGFVDEPRQAVERADALGARTIRGKALIFWDPGVPGRKLDAIDTDQITPAADCVSESLEHLDERWKAGAFRYLMPDFRERVHRGETFLVAGDRFAIGSSR